MCLVSCKTGDGIEGLLAAIEAHAAKACEVGLDRDAVFCNARHRAHLRKCIEALDEVRCHPPSCHRV